MDLNNDKRINLTVSLKNYKLTTVRLIGIVRHSCQEDIVWYENNIESTSPTDIIALRKYFFYIK